MEAITRNKQNLIPYPDLAPGWLRHGVYQQSATEDVACALVRAAFTLV